MGVYSRGFRGAGRTRSRRSRFRRLDERRGERDVGRDEEHFRNGLSDLRYEFREKVDEVIWAEIRGAGRALGREDIEDVLEDMLGIRDFVHGDLERRMRKVFTKREGHMYKAYEDIKAGADDAVKVLERMVDGLVVREDHWDEGTRYFWRGFQIIEEYLLYTRE